MEFTENDPAGTEIERALDSHVVNGYIKSWDFNAGPGLPGSYKVCMSNGRTAELRTPREVMLCCYGMETASQSLRGLH
jgi:hypothetical protein